MSPDREQLKAQMMAEAEAAIDRVLAEVSEEEDLQLSDIERVVRAAGQRVMKAFTGRLVETEARRKDNRACPQCGQRMRYKDRKGRNLVTETGEVRLKRAYYYCPSCRKGVFPPRPTMGAEQNDLQSAVCAADGMGEWSVAVREGDRGL
jgi:ribosomal protein S27AE